MYSALDYCKKLNNLNKKKICHFLCIKLSNIRIGQTFFLFFIQKNLRINKNFISLFYKKIKFVNILFRFL